MFMVGSVLTTFAFMIVALAYLAHRKPLVDIVAPQHFHDLGNLVLAFVMLWVYIAFSQYLIIWSGNLPEEIHWYLHRTGDGWKAVIVILMIFHFLLPFLILLSRRTKRRVRMVSTLAGAMIFMRLVDLFWIVAPAFHRGHFYIHWLDFVIPIGMGEIWIGVFVWQLQKRPLLPLHDPRLAEILSRQQVERSEIPRSGEAHNV